MLNQVDLEYLGSKFVTTCMWTQFHFNRGILKFLGVYLKNLRLDTLLLDWKISLLLSKCWAENSEIRPQCLK